MKDLKNILLEASMLDIEDTLASGDKYAESFGAMYKLKNIYSDRIVDEIKIFDIDKLIKITKDMYVSKFLKEQYKKENIQDYMYYMGIFIDNLNRKELKIDDNNICNLNRNDKLIKSFEETLKNILIDEDIFIGKKFVKVWTNSNKSVSIYFELNDREWVEFEYTFVE